MYVTVKLLKKEGEIWGRNIGNREDRLESIIVYLSLYYEISEIDLLHGNKNC